MPLSARRLLRRTVHGERVSGLWRLLASTIDGIIPSLGLLLFIRSGVLPLDFLTHHPATSQQMFTIDRLFLILYEQPELYLRFATTWMLLWSALSLVTLGSIQTTLGKRLTGLSLRQANGHKPNGLQLLARIVGSWLVPATLGLAYLWMAINPQGRGLHDVLSRTYVVRLSPITVRATPIRSPANPHDKNAA